MGVFTQKSSTWEPPAELQRSTPREVSLTASGKAIYAVAVLLVAGAFASFTWLYGRSSQDAQRWTAWQADAVSAQATIIEARKIGSGDDARIGLTYQYPANGTMHNGRARLRYKRWRHLQAGMTVPVRYLSSNPSVNWIVGAEPTGVPLWVPFLVACSLLVPAPIISYVIRKQRRLLEQGRPALAKVTATKKIHHQHGTIYRIEYEFQTLGGGMARGQADVNQRAPLESSELVILYHPDDPRWSARYPLCLVKVMPNN